MNDLTPQQRQRMVDRGTNNWSEVGIPQDRTYSVSDMDHIEEALVHVGSVLVLCRTDYVNMRIQRIWDDNTLSYNQKRDKVSAEYSRLSERFGMKEASLRAQSLSMKRWPLERRLPGLTVKHYQMIRAEIPDDIADQLLEDAAEEGWTSSELERHVLEHIMSSQNNGTTEWEPSKNQTGTGNGWGWARRAEEWIREHEIESIRFPDERSVVLQSDGGVLTVKSSSPLTIETSQQEGT